MSDPHAPARPLWLPAVILALLLALLWGWFVPRATEAAPLPPLFGTWDFHNYFLPRYVWGTQELLAGRIPLWSRLEFAGIPFLATLQPAALYPPKILAFALLGPEAAMKTYLVAHYVLLIASFLLFLRSQGIAGIGALAGGAFIAFNANTLTGDYHPFRIACFAWMPLIFWLADRAAKTRKRAPIAALALAVAMQLLAGYPEFTLHTALLLGVQAIAMWGIGAWTAPPWRTLPRLALGFGLGALLAGLQLAPFAELAAQSQRAAEAQAFVEAAGANIGTPPSFAQLATFAAWFVGGLGAFSLAALPRRRSLPMLACVLFAALMWWRGWMLLRQLPALSGIRHWYIWTITSQFAIAWLIALGADSFSRRAAASARGRFSGVTVAGLAAAWCALCILGLAVKPESPRASMAFRLQMVASRSFFFPDTDGAHHSRLAELAGGVPGGALARLLGAGGAALVVAAACVGQATANRDRLAGAGIVLVSLGQIAAYPIYPDVGPFRPFDSADRVGRLRLASAPPIGGRVFSFEDLRWGYAFFDRVESLFGLETSLPPARFHALQQRLRINPNWYRLDWNAFGAAEGFLDALDVEYVAAPWLVAASLPAASWERAPQNPSATALLRNRERPGRAWVAYAASVAPSEDAALDRLLAPDFDPRREVILESPLASIGPAPAGDPPTPARVTVVSPTHVEVESELPRPGILVLSEAWFPGWVAWVDGAPAEILRADYVLRGIALAAGSHRVRFEYRPLSVQIGVVSTLLGVCGVLGLVWSDQRRRGATA